MNASFSRIAGEFFEALEGRQFLSAALADGYMPVRPPDTGIQVVRPVNLSGQWTAVIIGKDNVEVGWLMIAIPAVRVDGTFTAAVVYRQGKEVVFSGIGEGQYFAEKGTIDLHWGDTRVTYGSFHGQVTPGLNAISGQFMSVCGTTCDSYTVDIERNVSIGGTVVGPKL